jgi:hypothetical protein
LGTVLTGRVQSLFRFDNTLSFIFIGVDAIKCYCQGLDLSQPRVVDSLSRMVPVYRCSMRLMDTICGQRNLQLERWFRGFLTAKLDMALFNFLLQTLSQTNSAEMDIDYSDAAISQLSKQCTALDLQALLQRIVEKIMSIKIDEFVKDTLAGQYDCSALERGRHWTRNTLLHWLHHVLPCTRLYTPFQELTS